MPSFVAAATNSLSRLMKENEKLRDKNQKLRAENSKPRNLQTEELKIADGTCRRIF